MIRAHLTHSPPTTFILFTGLVSSKGGGFDCNTSPPNVDGDLGQNECNVVTRGVPSCDTGKPETITFRYDGGSSPGNPGAQCATSTIRTAVNRKGKRHTDFECSGSVSGDAIAVRLDSGGGGSVNFGDTFTVPLKSIKEMSLSGGGQQNLVFHTSCSQPIAAGLTAGALTIVGLDNNFISTSVAYSYTIANTGVTDAVVESVFDDQIGELIDRPFTLEPGDSETIFANDNDIGVGTGSITNEVTVVANTPGQSEGCVATDSVTVRITQGPPLGGGSGKGKGKSSGSGNFNFGGNLGGGFNNNVIIGGSGSRRRRRRGLLGKHGE